MNEFKSKLESIFTDAEINIIDNTEDHLGHQSSTGMHIAVRVKWHGFEGKSLIEQHRMVQECLKEDLKEKIHALQIKTEVKNG
tara:strand:- start:615 stop:863 length:249 start_codon:yes stop_codon:yes gene_type:complete